MLFLLDSLASPMRLLTPTALLLLFLYPTFNSLINFTNASLKSFLSFPCCQIWVDDFIHLLPHGIRSHSMWATYCNAFMTWWQKGVLEGPRQKKGNFILFKWHYFSIWEYLHPVHLQQSSPIIAVGFDLFVSSYRASFVFLLSLQDWVKKWSPQSQQNRRSSLRSKWGCWMEGEGSTLCCRKNPLRVSTSIFLPSSPICVTGESCVTGVKWYLCDFCIFYFTHFDLYIKWPFPFSVSPLGNLRTQLCCCSRRSTTNKASP